MGIAITTAVIILAVIPGLVFKYTYFGGKYGRRSAFLPITEEVTFAIVPALVIHGLSAFLIYLVDRIFYTNVDNYGDRISILESYPVLWNNTLSNIEILDGYFSLIVYGFVYTFFISFIAFTVSRYLSKVVRDSETLSDIPLLNPDNDWLEALPIQLTKGNTLVDAEVDTIKLDILTQVGANGYIFQGFVEEVYFQKNGNLDRIVMSGVRRREITKDPTISQNESRVDRFYDVPGDFMVFNASTILNHNITLLTT